MRILPTLFHCSPSSLGILLLLLQLNSAFAQPIVDLGADTAVCGDVVLDANNPGATFLWSTNESTQTILVSTTGIYWVDVTDGSGTTRDSIFVTIVAEAPTPNINDTSVCGTGIFTFSSGVIADQVLWYDSPTGENVVASGDPVQLSINSTSTFYVQSINSAPFDTVGWQAVAGMPLGFQSAYTGTEFDVLTPSILKNVTVFANQPATFRIQLEDNGGGILDSVTVSIPGSGSSLPTVVPLDFNLTVGTGFRLMADNITTSGNGLGFTNIPAGYPFEVPGVISLTSTADGSTTRVYNFFDWVVTQTECKSDLDTVTITLLSAPDLDLGPDSIYCGGSVVLDASFPGASYLWSTGDTTPTLTVTQDDTISVASTIASCTISDTVIVGFISSPSTPLLSDTSVCGTGEFSFSAGAVSDEVFWFDSPSGGNVVAIGNPAQINLDSSSTFYVEAVNYAPFDTVGLAATPGIPLGFQSTSIGLQFDVFTPLILQSVTVFTNQETSFRIQLEENGGAILDSITVTVQGNGNSLPIVVPLNFTLPVGTGFRLMGTNITPSGSGNGLGFTNIPSGYPFEVPGIISLTSTDIGQTNRYNNFFDWVVTRQVCKSPRAPITITSLPSPEVELGPDTSICGTSLLLDANFPGASYIWTTGATTASITANVSDLYGVELSLGNCSVSDSVFVTLVPEPAVPTTTDIDVCGPGDYNLSASGNHDLVLWYESDTSSSFFAEGNTPLAFVSDSTTFYAEALNFAELDTTGVTDLSTLSIGFQPNDRGLDFDVFQPSVLKSVAVYSDEPGFMHIRMETSSGTILDSVTVFLPNGNGVKNVVPLYFDLPVGTDFRLMGTVVSGLGSGLGFLNVSLPFPYVVPDVMQITSGNGFLNRYYYFFDWVVTKKVCRSVREPMDVNVLPAPVIDLGPDTAVCGNDYLLSALNAGATYLWSTGETSSSILVISSDTIYVDATIGTCTIRDSVAVELVSSPDNLVPNDTNICNVGVHPYTFQHEGDLLLWYEDPLSETILGTGDTLFYLTQDTTTLYAESVAFSEQFVVGRSVTNPVLAGYQDNIRGVEFTVHSPVVISSISMYADLPTDATLLLETQQGVALDSFRVHVPDMLGTEVFPFFRLAPGSYRLLGKDITGGKLAFFGSGSNYPYEVPGIISINGAENGSTSGYYYFFDWKVARQACFSPREAVTIEIALPLDLGEDLYSCDPVQLDAGNPGINILWSTGESTPLITVTETGKYWVDLSDGQGCVSSDTIEITIPSLDLGEDGTICGTSLITGYDSTSVFLWNTGDTTSNLALADTGLFWVTIQEPLGCTLTDTIFVSGFADFPVVDLGADFSACDSASIDAGNPGMSYLWSTGDTTQSIQIFSAGSYNVAVTNQFGCTTEDEVNVFIAPSPNAEFAYQANGGTILFENLSSLGSNFWNFGDGNTSTLLSPVHTYSDTGTYTVRLVVVDILNNCGSDTFFLEIHISSLTSIDGSFLGGKIDVYPNPTSQQFTVDFQEIRAGEAEILLFDPSGREILRTRRNIFANEQKERINVPPHTAEGLYYLVVRMEKARFIQKIMIQ